MATAALKKKARPFGPESNGIVMAPEEFDRAEFVEGHRYELINEVLIVSPIPSEGETDPNEELGHWLRSYQEDHPRGSALDKTLPEGEVRTGKNRRRADRLIWAGLGRLPRKHETPSIIAEFVSARKRDRLRDYEVKRDEYLKIHVREYWVIDRFARIVTVFSCQGTKARKRVVREGQTYRTPLLPGFELPLSRLLTFADAWPSEEDEDE